MESNKDTAHLEFIICFTAGLGTRHQETAEMEQQIKEQQGGTQSLSPSAATLQHCPAPCCTHCKLGAVGWRGPACGCGCSDVKQM